MPFFSFTLPAVSAKDALVFKAAWVIAKTAGKQRA
jgi:hypothetical protein